MIGMVVSMSQGVPARVVVLDATLGGKPYGTVTYQRGLVPGVGRERRVTFDVDDESGKYRITEHRTYKTDGTPLAATRTFSDESHKMDISVSVSGKTASVVFDYGKEKHSEEFLLSVEGAETIDVSQTWFYGTAPKVGTTATLWEFSLESSVWVERTVKYEGVAKIKVGEANVNSHRVKVGKDATLYLDGYGMPYKTSQETAKGTLTMVRRGGAL